MHTPKPQAPLYYIASRAPRNAGLVVGVLTGFVHVAPFLDHLLMAIGCAKRGRPSTLKHGNPDTNGSSENRGP